MLSLDNNDRDGNSLLGWEMQLKIASLGELRERGMAGVIEEGRETMTGWVDNIGQLGK